MPTLSRSRWALACALGLCLAFLSFLPGSRAMNSTAPWFGLDKELVEDNEASKIHPSELDAATHGSWHRLYVVGHIFNLAVFGLLLTGAQAIVLKGSRVHPKSWLLLGLGYPLLLVPEALWPRIVLGPHSGPVEPLIILVGGGSLLGFLQWQYLRRRGVQAGKWYGLWILGLVLGFAAVIPPALLLENLKESIGIASGSAFEYGLDLVLLGSVSGAVAGLVSGGAMVQALRNRAAQ